jgi:copper chaperone CopZ
MAKFRFVVAGLAFVVTLALLFAGWNLYRTYGLVRPVERQVAQIPGVERVSVSVAGKTALVRVTLGAVDDLKSTYQSIQRTVSDRLGSQVIVELQGHSSPSLDRWWDEQQPLLYEDLEKSNFRDLVMALQNNAAEHHLRCRVTMDAAHIYVQASDERAYLYQVVPYRAIGHSLPSLDQRG